MFIVRRAIPIALMLLAFIAHATMLRIARNVLCSELSEGILKDILGAAYNSRYMSILPPGEDAEDFNESMKRHSPMMPTFYVDQDFAEELGNDEPAWKVHHLEAHGMGHSRAKRRVAPYRQWECPSKIAWTDLGPDYYPRYLRSVECLTKNCWYGHYVCKPRSFTVKILKRRKGRCVFSDEGSKVGEDGLPQDLRELWVWEERAVNFCCDCSL